MFCGWAGNRMSRLAVVMRHKLKVVHPSTGSWPKSGRWVLHHAATVVKKNALLGAFLLKLDWVLSCWVHFTVHSLDLFVCILCFVFHTAYMLCYCQHSGVDLVGLKPSPYVGWVFWPIKPVSDMTYNAFGRTLNLAQLQLQLRQCCVCRTEIERSLTLVVNVE